MLLLFNTSDNVMFIMSAMKDLTPQYLIVFLSLSVYILIIVFNLTLIIIIFLEKSLHNPMYIFVCNLCLNALYGTSGFYPKFISVLLSPSHDISYNECIAQSYVIYTSFMCECTTLVIMAYDRYVAICRPLEYHSIIRNRTVAMAILYSWAFPLFVPIPNIILTKQLPLCGLSIDRLYCDNWSIVKLSCVPATVSNVYGLTVLGIFFIHALVVMFSYQRLIVSCKKSADNKKKFVQTCGPHLLSLLNFTIAGLFDILFSRYGTTDFPILLKNAFQVEILLIPPLFNPVIYGFKLSEVRKRLFRNCRIMRQKHSICNMQTFIV